MQAAPGEGQAPLSAARWLRDRAARLAAECCGHVVGAEALH